MLSPIFDALEFIHKAGFLYENLSLDNIIFTQSGVKLMDFCDSSIDYLEKQDEDADFDIVFRPYPIPFERMSPNGKVGAWCDAAAESARECIRLAPEGSDGYLLLGVALCQKGDKKNGLPQLLKAKELGNGQADALLERYK